LLQVFDDGRLTDSKGRVVNCKNSLFIMTSNLGSDRLLEKMERNRKSLIKEELMLILDPVVKSHFRPEFINRLDDILPFLPLHEEDMEKIVKIQLDLLAKRLHDRDVELSWTTQVLAHLAKEGYEPAFGARPLKRYIQQEVVNKLSKAILEGKIPPRSKVKLELTNNEITFKVTPPKA
jgi:ATP-dependent Clp protease ATP-binding subunit ClpB